MNWKRFWFFAILGAIAAGMNLGIMVILDDDKYNGSFWRAYNFVGVCAAFFGTLLSLLHLAFSRFGTGGVNGGQGFDDRYHEWREDPVPRSGGFALGFGGFYVVMIITLFMGVWAK